VEACPSNTGTVPASSEPMWFGVPTRLVLEWSGAFTGILGSLLIAVGHVAAGFWLFLVSNLLLLGYATRARAYGIGVMQCLYTATSILGIARWMS